MACIQSSRHPGASPLGLLISDPEHFSRKWSTHLFHPEYGTERTMLCIIMNGERFVPTASNLVVSWDDEQCIVAHWEAGGVQVIERFSTIWNKPIVIRDVTLRNLGGKSMEC